MASFVLTRRKKIKQGSFPLSNTMEDGDSLKNWRLFVAGILYTESQYTFHFPAPNILRGCCPNLLQTPHPLQLHSKLPSDYLPFSYSKKKGGKNRNPAPRPCKSVWGRIVMTPLIFREGGGHIIPRFLLVKGGGGEKKKGGKLQFNGGSGLTSTSLICQALLRLTSNLLPPNSKLWCLGGGFLS